MMKPRTKTIVTYLIFLVLLVSLFTGGCIGKSSELSGENGTEKKEVNNSESSPTDRLKTEKINLSDSGAGNFTFAGNYRLEAINVELKAPSYELPLNKERISNYGDVFRHNPSERISS